MGWDKCFTFLLFGHKSVIKKAKISPDMGLIECRVGWREKISIIVPDGVKGEPFRKNKLIFLVDVKSLMAKNWGEFASVPQVELNEIKSKLNLIAQGKFWRFVGGRGLDLVETLVLLGAGYGFLRLVEDFIRLMFQK